MKTKMDIATESINMINNKIKIINIWFMAIIIDFKLIFIFYKSNIVLLELDWNKHTGLKLEYHDAFNDPFFSVITAVHTGRD